MSNYKNVKKYRDTDGGFVSQVKYELSPKGKARKRWLNQDKLRLKSYKNRDAEFQEIYGDINVVNEYGLTEIETDILLLYFGLAGEPHFIDECAERLNLSIKEAKDIKASALRKLNTVSAHELRDI